MIQVVVASVCQRSPAARYTSLCKRDAPSCAVAFLILCRPEDSSWEMSMYEGGVFTASVVLTPDFFRPSRSTSMYSTTDQYMHAPPSPVQYYPPSSYQYVARSIDDQADSRAFLDAHPPRMCYSPCITLRSHPHRWSALKSVTIARGVP